MAVTVDPAQRGRDALAFRESRANVYRRIGRGESPETCEGCGTEADVTFPAHAPTCPQYGAAEAPPEQQPAGEEKPEGWYRDDRGRRLHTKTHHADGSKTGSQMTREHDAWLDAQPMTTRCGVAGCDWSVESTAGDGPELARRHRAEAHAWMDGKRARVVEQRVRREEAEKVASTRREAALAGLSEREPEAREEALLGGDPSPAIGESPVAVAVVEEPSGSRSESVAIALPAADDFEARRRRRRPYTDAEVLAAFERFREEHGRLPIPSDARGCAYLPGIGGNALPATRFKTWQGVWDHFGAGKVPNGQAARKFAGRGWGGNGRSDARPADGSGGARVPIPSRDDAPPEEGPTTEEAHDAQLLDEPEEAASVLIPPVTAGSPTAERDAAAPDLEAVRAAALHAVNAIFDLLAATEKACAR